jgi:hypothetical protein
MTLPQWQMGIPAEEARSGNSLHREREWPTKKSRIIFSRFDWFVATLLSVVRDVMDGFRDKGTTISSVGDRSGSDN